MITETGRVVAVEADCLWVETIRQSTCGSCVAQKGCGHGLLNQLGSGRRSYLRALLNNQSPDDFAVDDEVSISIPEHVLVQGALLVYIVPLIGLLAGAMLASLWWQGDIAAFIGGLFGFTVGIAVVRWHAVASRNNSTLQPIVMPGGKPRLASSAPIALDLR